jgi:hypothetical protein
VNRNTPSRNNQFELKPDRRTKKKDKRRPERGSPTDESIVSFEGHQQDRSARRSKAGRRQRQYDEDEDDLEE